MKYILPFLCLFFTISSYSQEEDLESSLFIIGLRYHYSDIIQHSPKLTDEVSSSNPWSIEMDFNWHLRKRGLWIYCYCYPRTGISLMYSNFAMPDVLGSAITVYPFIEPFIRGHKPLNFSIRFGIGPSYMTKVFDEETNPNNLFFSAPLSFLAMVNVGINYRATDRLNFRISGNYLHISNGGYTEPNLGINYPSVSAGVDYSLRPTRFEERDKDPDVVLNPRKNRFDVVTFFSAKAIAHGKDKRYPVYGLSLGYSRVIGRLAALSGGIEWVCDRSVRQKIREDNAIDSSGNYIDHNRIGALVGVDWLFGRFIFYQQFGFYLYSPAKAKNFMYQRYGINFKISDHMYAGINIKAHGQDADFMDFRMGFFF